MTTQLRAIGKICNNSVILTKLVSKYLFSESLHEMQDGLSKVHKYRNDWQTIVYNVHDKSCPAKLKMISMKGERNSWSSDELLCGINRTNYLSRRSKLDNIVTETDISVIEISFKLSYFLNYLYRSKTLMKQFCSSQM